MKKPLLALGVLALLGGGLWWLARRPARTGTLEFHQEAFRMEPVGQGTALAFENPSLPLRAFRWLPPDPTGTVFAQIVTQTDRQELGWFREGRLEGHLPVPKPEHLPEGAYRLMELVEALRLPDGAALLAYRAPAAPEALDLLLLDLGGTLRWHAHAPGTRLVLASNAKGSPEAVVVFGGAHPLLRLPLVAPRNEPAGGLRHLPEGLALPPELPQATDLIDLNGALIAAGPAGLATYRDGAWTFEPAPGTGSLAFPEPRARLVRLGSRSFWQPEPGRVLEVNAEGQPVRGFDFDSLPLAGTALEKDAALLQLLGADAQGWLWFTLATPSLPKASEPPPAVKEEGWATEAPPTAEPIQGTPAFDRASWEAYLAQDRGRIYRYSPAMGTLEQLVWKEAWPALGAAGFPPPAEPGRLRPASGWMLAEAGPRAWMAPLKLLPWRKVDAVKAPGTP